MSRKRARERPAVDTQLAEIFEDLADIDESIRLRAARSLLKTFVSNQDTSSEQISHIFNRLFRGICSGRKAARLGFSVALTEGLSQVFQPEKKRSSVFQNAGQVVDLLRNSTSVSSEAERQEDRDHQLGRLFGADAILRSGILFDSEAGLDAWSEILDVILTLAKKKTWLREQCGFVLYQSAIRLGSDKESDSYAQSMIDKFQSHKLLKTSEGIAVWIEIRTRFPLLHFPPGIWHNDTPLDRNDLSRLASILRESSQKQEENATNQSADVALPKGSWSANLHFAWITIIENLASRPWCSDQQTSSEVSSVDLEQFWLECVDEGLFKSSSSKERKYWGLLIFQHALSLASTSQQFSTIFSPNLMHCLVNHLTASERYLHLATEKTCGAIIHRASADTSCQAAIVEAMIQAPISTLGIDLLSRNKNLECLLTALDKDDAAGVLLKLEALLFHRDALHEEISTVRRHKLVELLATALRNTLIMIYTTDPKSTKADGYIQKLLQFFATHAYFDTSTSLASANGHEPDAVPSPLQDVFKSRLSSCLVDILGKTQDPSLYVVDLVQNIREKSQIGAVKPLLQSEGHVQEVMDQTWRIVKVMISDGQGKPNKFYQSAELLLCLNYLQVHNGDPDAVSVLEELNGCFSKERLEQFSAENFVVSEALVEIIISLVSKPSQFYRRLAHQVFETWAPHVDSTGLGSMFNVLDTKESLAGQMDIFDQDEEDEEDESDAETSSDNASGTPSDVEEIEANGSDEELAAFDAKLAQALGTRPGQEDAGASENGSAISSSDMGDSDMEALDAQLSTVFRERKKLATSAASKRKEHKDARENMINFKCRILELLEVFVKKQTHTTLALTVLIPVLSLLRRTSSPLVIKKARGLIQEYARRARGKKLPTLDKPDATFTLLQAVHEEFARPKTRSDAHAAACSQASLLLVKVLVRHDRECLGDIARTYATTQGKMDPAHKAKQSFFSDWDHWRASISGDT